MPAKILEKGEKARQHVLDGVTTLNDYVKATLGPKGRNILIEDARGRPLVTKDGVSVAEEVELEDPFQKLGADLVKDAARRTNEVAGDGTTTATILAQAMMEGAMKHLGDGANPILIKKGMDDANAKIAEELIKMSKPVKKKADYAAVATISSQNEEIGNMIADMVDELGEDGIITVQDGQTGKLERDVVQGMQIDAGWKSPYFCNDGQNCVLEDCAVLVTDARITDINQIVEFLNGLVSTKLKKIAIFCDDLEGEALAVLITNRLRGVFDSVVVRVPGHLEAKKELLKDIAIVTHATFITADTDNPIEKARAKDAGFAKKIIVSPTTATIVKGKGEIEAIEKRADELKQQLETTESDHDKNAITKRIARLIGGVGVISVGGLTEVETLERKHRVEDALSATRAAAAEGILPGGGVALIRVLQAFEGKSLSDTELTKDEQIGWQIVLDAVTEPLKVLAENCGKDADAVLKKVLGLKKSEGYNALTDTYEDLVEARVIDPTLVTRSALENAVSVASMFVTLQGVIAKKPLDTQEKALAAMLGGRQ